MRPNLRFSASAHTHEGRVRSANEDSLLVRSDIGLWAVADGMGGHENGQWASQTVVEALGEVVATGDFQSDLAGVEAALQLANDRIRREAEARGKRMGSTVVVLMADGSDFACAWVGDSRIYRLRDRRLEQITRDHTQVRHLLETNQITEAEAEHHPMGHVLTRAVGVDPTVRIDRQQLDIAADDIFLICSDGLTACANADEIAKIVGEVGAAKACARLVEICLDRGAPDNVSIVTIVCDEVTAVELTQPEPEGDRVTR